MALHGQTGCEAIGLNAPKASGIQWQGDQVGKGSCLNCEDFNKPAQKSYKAEVRQDNLA